MTDPRFLIQELVDALELTSRSIVPWVFFDLINEARAYLAEPQPSRAEMVQILNDQIRAGEVE